MENKPMTEKESLDLIARMIQNTQNRFERYAGVPFLVWGYTTIIISLAVWLLVTNTGNYNWHFLWFGIIPIGGSTMFLFFRNKEKNVKTYTDLVVNYIWIVIGVAALLAAIMSMFDLVKQILFIEALLLNMGTALTGLSIRLKYVTVMGFVGIILSGTLLFFPSGWEQILIFALIVFISMVIPGHMMNIQASKYNSGK